MEIFETKKMMPGQSMTDHKYVDRCLLPGLFVVKGV